MSEQIIVGPDGKKYRLVKEDQATSQPQDRGFVRNMLGDGDWWRNQLANVAQGMSFGFADELESVVTGVPHENLRAGMREFRSDNPISSTVAEVAGGMLGGGGLFGLAKTAAPKISSSVASWAANNLPRWAQMAIPGAVGGATYGAGVSEPGMRAEGAITGGLLGGAVPIAGYTGYKLSEKAFKSALRPLWRRVMSSDRDRALQIIGDELRRSGYTPDDALKALQGSGDDAMLMDLSPYLQSLAYDSQAGLGPGKTIINQALNTRQAGQQQRIINAAGRNLGAYADDAKQFLDNIGQQKVQQAAPYYARAHSQNIRQTVPFQRLLQRVPDSAFKEARAIARARGIDLDDLPDVEKIDYIKRGLDSIIRKGFTGNSDSVSPTLAREYTILKNEILDYVDEAVPDFKVARGIWAGASELEEAAKLGRDLFKMDADEVTDYVRSFSDSEKLAFRYGVAQAFRDKVEQAGASGNAVSRLSRSTKQRNIIKAAFDNDEEFDQFLSVLDRESDFSNTRNIVQGNSLTQARQQARAERIGETPGQISGITDFIMRQLRPEDPLQNEEVNRIVSQYLAGRQIPGATMPTWRPPMQRPGLLSPQQPLMLTAPRGLLR